MIKESTTYTVNELDKAGTRNKSCSRLQQSREQFAILESLRKRTEKVYWQKVQRGEGN